MYLPTNKFAYKATDTSGMVPNAMKKCWKIKKPNLQMQLECIMSLKFLTSDSFYVGSVKSLKPVM